MSIAVSCNLSDGVILGVDSAVTISDRTGSVLKVYENAEKLFQLGDKPVGIAIYGIAGLHQRSAGSYIREFELQDPNGVISNPRPIVEIVEELRRFFTAAYLGTVGADLEQETGKKFDDIPKDKKPALGLLVGGFSPGTFLSEVWSIVVPLHSQPNSAQRRRNQGEFGSDWFANPRPIMRYIHGYDHLLLKELTNHVSTLLGRPLTKTETQRFQSIVEKYEYPIVFDSMPVEVGIGYVRFLVDLVIGHFRYTTGAELVGGKARIGVVTYKGEKFKILD